MSAEVDVDIPKTTQLIVLIARPIWLPLAIATPAKGARDAPAAYTGDVIPLMAHFALMKPVSR
jgi:hypothetical protein